MIKLGILFTVIIAILKIRQLCKEYLMKDIADIITNS